MDTKRKEIYSSLTEHIEAHSKIDDLKGIINTVEEKLQSLKATRERITEMYRSNSVENTNLTLKSHKDVLEAINYKCNLLLPDMIENYDINIEETIGFIKEYALDLLKNYVEPPCDSEPYENHEFSVLNLSEYAESLNVLNERLSRFNLNRRNVSHSKRNFEVEHKLAKMSEELDLFTKMVKAHRTLSEGKQSHNMDTVTKDNYCQLVERLLAKTNEASFILMKTKNN